MQFSIIYWNVWLDNQINAEKGAENLFVAIDDLIERYNPDCFGLNEVLKQHNKTAPFLLEYFQKRGYKHTYFLPSGSWDDTWDIGDAIISKYPIASTSSIPLGDHFTSRGRDVTGRQATALMAEVLIANIPISILVAHLMHLRPNTLVTHFIHQKNLSNYIKKIPSRKNLVVGGDFNEFKLMPFSFARKNRLYLHGKTGSLLHSTWHKNARSQAILRANPDKIFWTRNGLTRLDRYEIIQNHTSDHKPLYAEFSIQPISHFGGQTIQSWLNTLLGFWRATYTVFYIRGPIHSLIAKKLKKSPQTLQAPLPKELSKINDVLQKKTNTSIRPRLKQKELVGLMAVLMQFTSPVPKIQPFCQTQYTDIDRLYNAIIKKGKKEPLGFAEQLHIALTQTNGDLPEALWRLFITSRQYARWFDTETIIGIPDLTKEQIIERMVTWSKSVKATKQYGTCPDQDTAGDTYYCWTHALAKLAYNSLPAKRTIVSRFEALALQYGTELNHALAHKTKPQGVPSDHRIAAAYGNKIGEACIIILGKA